MMMRPDGNRRLLEGDVSKARSPLVTIARFGTYFRQYWVGFTLAMILVVISTFIQVETPVLMGQVVDCYLYPNPAECWYTDLNPATMEMNVRLSGLGELSLLLTVMFVAGSLLGGLAFFSMAWSGHNSLRAIRKDLFNHMHRLPLSYYSHNEAGNIMSRVTSDTDTIQQVFGFALMSVISGVLLIIGIVISMLMENIPYALVSLIVAPIMMAATVYFSHQARIAFRRSRDQMGSVNADLQESISGMREVQAFNREEESINQFRQQNAANRDANVRAAAFTSALNPVLEALGYVAIAIVIMVGGYSLIRQEPLLGSSVVSLGTVIAFLSYVQRYNQPIQQIAVLWTNIQSAIAGGERIFALLDTPSDLVDKPNAIPMPAIKGRVEFQNVRAEYEIGEPVLKGVSFAVEPGQTVAIVGPTGAGKTTIINLIPRFYDVTEGAVKIDGVDVRDVQLASLRTQIGVVLQDTFLFSDTVMNNIRYGRLDATDEEVIAAAKMVAADTFIEKLSEGYNTVLGERGSGLSQGQRQLIAIARAALKSPQILILDEATSSVDTRTERLIQQAFEKLLAGRTSFVIAHRLSTIRNADVVMMLRGGEIIERGTHQSLLDQRGAYYNLYMSQFQQEEPITTSVPSMAFAAAK